MHQKTVKLKKIVLLSLVATSTLMAEGYKIDVAMSLDSNAKQSYYPDLVLPMNWSDSLSSSIEYRSGEQTDERETTEVTIDENIQHQRFKLNALNYIMRSGKNSYSFGVGGSYESFAKEQKGSYSISGDNGTYSNNVDISVLSLYAKAETIQRLDFADVKFYALLNPMNNLSVEQKTVFVGDIADSSKADSDESTGLSYEVDLNFATNTGTFVDFGFNANYRVLPIKYDLNVLGITEQVDIEEKITKLQGNLYFNIDALSGWMPTLAYSTETTDADGDTYTEEKIYLGFNTRF